MANHNDHNAFIGVRGLAARQEQFEVECMTWKLVREVGIEYAANSDGTHRQPLSFPTYAAQAADGSYLIAEERGINKLVPFRFECRTLSVQTDGKVAVDSTFLGVTDGFGGLMDDGCLAIIRRSIWELIIVSPDGECVDRLELQRCSKRIPRYARWTSAGTLLVVFFNRSFDVDIVEIDRRGQLLWCLPASERSLGIPGSVQLLEDDTLLVADSFRHYVSEITRDGKTVWQFGQPENPSSSLKLLSSPSSAVRLADGRHLVADTRNHRVLSIFPDGSTQAIAVPESGLCDPTYATELAGGDYLICDTGNARVIRVNPQGDLIWQYGDGFIHRRHLSYPRSIEMIGRDRYLVADTGNNRVLEFNAEGARLKTSLGEQALFWPRCVRYTDDGTLLIADARNGRIVEMTESGKLVNELGTFQLDSLKHFSDPHDVRLLPNGHLLVCDSPHNLIVEVDWSGHVYRSIGLDDHVQLKDPHSAQQLLDGSVLVADTGNHRLVFVSADGAHVRALNAVTRSQGIERLQHPRYAEVSRDGTLVIADTAQNRILGCTIEGEYLWELSNVDGSKIEHLNQPRWATMINQDELLVCDHFHHRFLHLRSNAGRLTSSES